ncbi:hypothetical protein SAE02_76940 [Skermanella aerolata]|uniref:Response regulatory domain-containing protein n=1 Tax=Skermanella aerolata TaxID=393310 RepID=A0A512E482_9PROT|nr:response regulator [Skermanella aerolata]KJB90099.1 hypothetical protein N826_06330 [Skermanella aerolata KACC 11604]GEO43546.1 hypothetical protein SAE02_76940 [Skermanella aerolata]
MRVLIVEDEVIIAIDIQDTLESAGHTVIGIALTINDALAFIQAGCPDLALININLREGRGAGINLARDLLEQYRVPSLFVSGQCSEARQNRDAALGYLAKPWRTRALLDSVEVARRLINGQDPAPLPPELELFGWRQPQQSGWTG